MTIQDAKGESHDVVGTGWGTLNTILGTIGTLGAVSGGNGLFSGLLGGNNKSAADQYVTRYDADMMHQIAAKDAEIANLNAKADTDKKLVDVYTALKVSENNLRDRVDILDKEMSAKITSERESRLISEKEQAVFNQTMIGSTATINQQIAQLNTIVGEITTNVVPQSKVCNTCNCCCGND